jgi:hypothetical protein
MVSSLSFCSIALSNSIANLTFHTGALIDDPYLALEGEAKEARVFKVESQEELISKKAGLQKVINNWIKLKDSASSL